jgi:hypothetical protein
VIRLLYKVDGWMDVIGIGLKLFALGYFVLEEMPFVHGVVDSFLKQKRQALYVRWADGGRGPLASTGTCTGTSTSPWGPWTTGPLEAALAAY